MKFLLFLILWCCGTVLENDPGFAAATSRQSGKKYARTERLQRAGRTPSVSAQAVSVPSPGKLVVTFDFTRGGIASSQFAVWVENAEGELLKTLFVTRFTASGGYLRRQEAVPEWVQKADPSALARAQLDAVSGATPRNGIQTYVWDGTDNLGRPVPRGEYRFFIEGTFYWWNRVVYSGSFVLGGPAERSIPLQVHYIGSDDTNKNMISDVRAEYVPVAEQASGKNRRSGR